MNGDGKSKPKLPFAAEKESTQFFQEVVKLLIVEFDKRRQKYVAKENFQIFHHGIGWNFQRQEKGGFKPHAGELKLQSTNCNVKTDRILANDINVIAGFIRETADRMEESLFRLLTEEMNAVTSETGNTISIAKEGSLADAFLAAIKATQAGVAPDGSVSRPTLFLNDKSLFEKLQRELAERGPEFQKQFEAARSEQEQKSLAQEAERLAKYDHLE